MLQCVTLLNFQCQRYSVFQFLMIPPVKISFPAIFLLQTQLYSYIAQQIQYRADFSKQQPGKFYCFFNGDDMNTLEILKSLLATKFSM